MVMKERRRNLTKVWIICAMFVLGIASVASAEEPQGVAGDWKGTYESRTGNRADFWFTLRQDGEAITGTLTNPQNPLLTNVAVVGTFRGNTISLQIPSAGGAVEGTVSGDTMTGMWMGTTRDWLRFTVTRAK